MQKESGRRFRRLYQALTLSRGEAGAILGVTPQTVLNWTKSEPRLSEAHRRILMAAGVNPLYVDGASEITLPGVTLDQAIDSVKSIVNSSTPAPCCSTVGREKGAQK